MTWQGKDYAPAAAITDPNKVIVLLVDRNPKRSGSKSARRFRFHRDGQTVAQYLAMYDRKLAALDLRWDLAHGFIALMCAECYQIHHQKAQVQ